MTLSVVCMGAVISTLVYIREKPLTFWTLPIAPNTLVSVFSTLAKSALMLTVAECISQLKWLHFQTTHKLVELDHFDEASRGPFGSLLFLWKINITSALASLGALITIFALAADPFTQQVISFPSRNVSLGLNTASFGITQIYDSGATALSGSPNRKYSCCVAIDRLFDQPQRCNLEPFADIKLSSNK